MYVSLLVGGWGNWAQILYARLCNLVAEHITCYISSRTCYMTWLCNIITLLLYYMPPLLYNIDKINMLYTMNYLVK